MSGRSPVDGGGRAACRRYSAAARRCVPATANSYTPRLASTGAWLQRRYGAAVTVSLEARDIAAGPNGRANLAALSRLDHAFVADASTERLLSVHAPRLPATVVAPGVSGLPWPGRQVLRRVTRALRGIVPGRLVAGVVWPSDPSDVRWFRDLVAPAVEANPAFLLLGVPGRREMRLTMRAIGVAGEFRSVGGEIGRDLMSAAARCIDVFLFPGGNDSHGEALARLALMASAGGVPVVTDAPGAAAVLDHERNAFVVAPGDDRTFTSITNRLLAMPAVQRHALGAEFTHHTLAAWPWSRTAAAYTERFASLVGRPQIPAQLRAA
jgi:glycosyltransferase involved in cell wall biosynthesis